MVKCLICNKQYKNNIALAQHIKIHNINSENYYRKYLLNDKDNICKICGNETSFINLSEGFRDYCSPTCRANSKDVQNKYKETMLLKYNVDNSLKMNKTQERAHTKEASQKQVKNRIANWLNNNTLPESKAEKDFYLFLCTLFSKDDIYRQYNEERYPYYCDFYIKSLDLFIELNLFGTHLGKLFNPNDKNDLLYLKELETADSKFKNSCAKVWLFDRKKYDLAIKNNLNYRVCYNNIEIYNLKKELEVSCRCENKS